MELSTVPTQQKSADDDIVKGTCTWIRDKYEQVKSDYVDPACASAAEGIGHAREDYFDPACASAAEGIGHAREDYFDPAWEGISEACATVNGNVSCLYAVYVAPFKKLRREHPINLRKTERATTQLVPVIHIASSKYS